MAEANLTAARLRELTEYNARTGQFIWLVPKAIRVKAGDVVGALSSKGYLKTTIDGAHYRLNRLAYLYMTGEMPSADMVVDHIDGCKTNNAWENLRLASYSVNNQNRRTASGKAPALGVRVLHGKCITSAITVNGKRKHLGTFDTVEHAHAAYLEAKRLLHEGCAI